MRAYDILFACPQEHLALLGDGRLCNSSGAGIDGRFLDALDLAWQHEHIGRDPDMHLPFRGGWLLFLGYELAAQIEPRLRLPPAPDADLPVALAVRCPAAIIVDRELDCTHLVAEDAFAGLIDTLPADLDSAPEIVATGAASAVDEDAPGEVPARGGGDPGIPACRRRIPGRTCRANGAPPRRRSVRPRCLRPAPCQSRAVRRTSAVARLRRGQFVAGTTRRRARRRRHDAADRRHARPHRRRR
jgi:hypothetical protein